MLLSLSGEGCGRLSWALFFARGWSFVLIGGKKTREDSYDWLARPRSREPTCLGIRLSHVRVSGGYPPEASRHFLLGRRLLMEISDVRTSNDGESDNVLCPSKERTTRVSRVLFL